MDRIESFNKANLKRLNEKELRAIENSENISQHTKLLAFNELTNRNQTQIKKERHGRDYTQKKKKGV